MAGLVDGFRSCWAPVAFRISTKVTVEIPPLSDYRRTHLNSLIDSVRDKIFAVDAPKWARLNLAARYFSFQEKLRLAEPPSPSISTATLAGKGSGLRNWSVPLR